jgi:hypothetical protein
MLASDVISKQKRTYQDQPKIAQEYRMNQASPEGNFSSREDTLLKNTNGFTDPEDPRTASGVIILGEDSAQPIEISSMHGPTEAQEQGFLLGRQAANLALAIGVSNDHDVKVREVERFLIHAGPHEVFVNSIIDRIEGKTKTETAAALKAQNEALRQQIEMIKDTLKTQLSKEDLLKIAPFLKLPKSVNIDLSEFTGEKQVVLDTTPEQELVMPSTAELEASIENVTEDTVSPARGISLLSSRVLEKLVINPSKRMWEYLVPPLTDKQLEYESQLQHLR